MTERNIHTRKLKEYLNSLATRTGKSLNELENKIQKDSIKIEGSFVYAEKELEKKAKNYYAVVEVQRTTLRSFLGLKYQIDGIGINFIN